MRFPPAAFLLWTTSQAATGFSDLAMRTSMSSSVALLT
jgi:hypothetical protein